MSRRFRREVLPAIGAALLLLALLLLALSGCSARRGEPLKPEPVLNARQEQGERVFFKHCHQCHPNGEGGLGPAIHNKPLPSVAIRTQIRAGVGAMPAFPEEHLSDADVEALLAYLLEMQTPSQ